ncbi:hypothetical protein ACDJ95_16765 [Escherichia coli]|uniref:hypothetical protein n=6 Tax=Escherichia coli TaxID=562 RepID=UPI001485B722|nr:hypothetical protein [Escherichia coli]EFE4990977.1 hypothetical protein [Escherichia coli]EFI1498593.1 hypothetical protein [Escherichia coli]EFO4363870.1 hypothetical protein [Escherichia coli]HAW1497873.1 hypothetical protein [Escherichia coli]
MKFQKLAFFRAAAAPWQTTPPEGPVQIELLLITFTVGMMYIIETPFSHIPTAFGVALHNSATTVIKALATFATGKSSMDFPCRFFIFIDA